MIHRSGLMLLAFACVAASGVTVTALVMMPPTQTVRPEASTLPANPATAEFRAAVKSLSSEDFEVRAGAQRFIDKIGAGNRQWLVDAMSTGDAEAKIRLQKAIDVLDDELAVNPPAVTLRLKEASSSELIQALADQTGLNMHSHVTAEKYTLNVTQRPFGEVYGELCRTGINLNPARPDGIFTNLPKIFTYDVHKGFTTYFEAAVSTRRVDARGSAYQQTMVSVGVIADPRVHVLYCERPTIKRIVDSAGNVLMDRKTSGLPGEVNEARVYHWVDRAGFQIPEKPGERFATISGDTEFVVGVGEDFRVISDVGKHAGEKFVVGKAEFVLDKFEMDAEGKVTIALRRRIGVTPECYEVQVKNDKGVPIFRHSNVYRTEKEFNAREAGEMSMEISVPRRSVKITVPFELRNIAFPH